MKRRELKTALLITWMVLTIVAGLVLAAPFAVTPDTLAGVAPVCEWKARYNKPCALCGMTTAFILISHGNFQEAYLANKASIGLYAVLAANLIAGALFLLWRRVCKF